MCFVHTYVVLYRNTYSTVLCCSVLSVKVRSSGRCDKVLSSTVYTSILCVIKACDVGIEPLLRAHSSTAQPVRLSNPADNGELAIER